MVGILKKSNLLFVYYYYSDTYNLSVWGHMTTIGRHLLSKNRISGYYQKIIFILFIGL
jgi:hypothetical protein